MTASPAKYVTEAEGRLECGICPNRCVIAESKYGICGTRTNRKGEMELPFYGKLSATALDPIEKKPLYHFYPGSPILSIGFVGCSFRCPFCQNHSISQTTRRCGSYMSPGDLITNASAEKSFGIAYTYSEPLIHFEYILDCARLAEKANLKNVLVTNGYINPEPAAELLPYLDAANVDLKCFNTEFYEKEIGGRLEPVLRFIEQAAEQIHVEVTTLIIPGKNDSPKEIRNISKFLAGINPDIPYHLSCYYPTYKYTIPRTEKETVHSLASAAREYLAYVYPGNVGLDETNTYCPKCGNLLIRRSGYHTEVSGISQGSCSSCGGAVPITV